MRQSRNDFDLRAGYAAAAFGLLLLFAEAQAGWTQQAAAPGTPAPQTAASTARPVAQVAGNGIETQKGEAASPAKPGTEGLQVHGHWVLEVKKADGTIRDRREFDNSLVTSYSAFNKYQTNSGAAFLAGALAGTVAPGLPAIGFVQAPPTGLGADPSLWCTIPGSFLTASTCYVFANTADVNWNFLLNDGSGNNGIVLVGFGLNLAAVYTPSASLVLSGNYAVPGPVASIPGLTSIYAVQMLFQGCAPAGVAATAGLNNPALSGGGTFPLADVAPSLCLRNYVSSLPSTESFVFGALTSTILMVNGVATPMQVTQGEIVAVTLTITFS